MILGMLLLRKIVLAARTQRITSIADFIAAASGAAFPRGLVAALAVVVSISLLRAAAKAVSVSFDLLTGDGPRGAGWRAAAAARHRLPHHAADGRLHHPVRRPTGGRGPSIIPAWLSRRPSNPWSSSRPSWRSAASSSSACFAGPGDLFAQGQRVPEMARLLTRIPMLEDGSWITATILALLAHHLPAEAIPDAGGGEHRRAALPRAMWLFPLYLLLINIFVLPVALAGLILLPDPATDRDMVVLALPLVHGWIWLAVLVFIGGLSAAAGMIVVETIALSTMVSNNLVIPTLLRRRLAAVEPEQSGAPRLPVLAIRRVAIVVILLLGYAYFRVAGEAYALVAIGLISFAGVAQFAPALIGGLFWAGATRRGAIAGLIGGTLVWGYTLLLPSFARSGWLPQAFLLDGPWAIELLRPYALLGLEGLDPLTHALFWSALANVGLFVGVSVFDCVGPAQRAQAIPFMEALHAAEPTRARSAWTGAGLATGELTRLLRRLLGPERARTALADYATGRASCWTQTSRPMRSWCCSRNGCSPASLAPPRRAWPSPPSRRAARWGRRSCCACWMRPPRSSSTAAGSNRNRPSWSRPPPRCTPRTNASANSTG
jgi:Na+/proline symporter